MSLLTSIAVFFLMLIGRAALVLLIGCALAAAAWCGVRFADVTAAAGRWASRSGAGRWVVLLVMCAGALALADGKLSVPENMQLPQGQHSPGVVTFRHQMHVNTSAPDCTGCHPTLFRITVPGATADGQPLTHKQMRNGEQCGACHNGTDAHGQDQCDSCHSAE